MRPGVSGIGGPGLSGVGAGVQAVGKQKLIGGREIPVNHLRERGHSRLPLPFKQTRGNLFLEPQAFLHQGDELRVSPVADLELIVLDCEEVVVGEIELLKGIDSGALVPEANGFGSGEWADDQECQEKQQTGDAEDGAKEAEHELILTSAVAESRAIRIDRYRGEGKI